MKYIEIQTVEGGRLDWVAIYGDSRTDRLMAWASDLLRGVSPKPKLRVTEGLRGPVIGAWQADGYEAVHK